MAYRFAVVFILVAIVGYFAGRMAMPSVAPVAIDLNGEPVLVARLLTLRDAPVQVEAGCDVERDPYRVDHFLTAYIAYLNDPDTVQNARNLTCDEETESVCEISYPLGNEEQRRQYLRFEIDPETKEIQAGSLACFGK